MPHRKPLSVFILSNVKEGFVQKIFEEKYNQYLKKVNEKLSFYLPASETYPCLIHEAMNYSINAGGKRLRPILCMSVYGLFDNDIEKIMPVACALELVHTYSLIHDDLPCMDNDDFRRGLPTCHKKFSEAIAVLAGDALLTEAFALISSFSDKDIVSDIVSCIADACGSRGLIGGQVMDILSEGKMTDEKSLLYIHEHKTGKLIQVCAKLGGICSRACETDIKEISEYGRYLGLAFQISDDILDVTGSTQKLGKKAGQDEKLCKATYPSVFGLENSKSKLKDAVDNAISHLDIFGERKWFLENIAKFVAYRDK